MLRCAITDLESLPGVHLLDSPAKRWSHLRGRLERWAFDGIDVVQLRAKHLHAGELFSLTHQAVRLLADLPIPSPVHLLVNGRADVAAAAGAAGVHLTSRPGELTPAQVRSVFQAASHRTCTASQSCHSLPEVETARARGVNLILFGPVFEKRVHGEHVMQGTGLAPLQAACTAAGPVPVLALGGVTAANTAACLHAGAAGIASIRLFA